jgi:hypothetical protein
LSCQLFQGCLNDLKCFHLSRKNIVRSIMRKKKIWVNFWIDRLPRTSAFRCSVVTKNGVIQFLIDESNDDFARIACRGTLCPQYIKIFYCHLVFQVVFVSCWLFYSSPVFLVSFITCAVYYVGKKKFRRPH